MHTLAFLDPGHFHAALTLREGNPRVSDDIYVYAPEGPEVDDFLALVQAFNRRAERPTRWRPIVRAGERSLERLVADRPGDIAILAGRNDRKAALIRALHDAGFHVLADKPWLAGGDGIEDVRRALAGGPVAAEIMTGRHDVAAALTQKLVGDACVFGGFGDAVGRPPDIEITSVHYLEKQVNGAPLRRPPWFFDVRVQGDALADIPTHMVDQAQRLAAAAAGRREHLELVAARRSPTRVPRAVYSRITGQPDFPPEVRELVTGGALSYYGNGALSFRAGAVSAELDTRWDLSTPEGGGDAHRSAIRGRQAVIRVEQGPETGFRRRLSVTSVGDAAPVKAALGAALASWQSEHPGVALVDAGDGWEIAVPRALDAGHESHFPLVLSDFLAMVEQGGGPPGLAAQTLDKYELLARASLLAADAS